MLKKSFLTGIWNLDCLDYYVAHNGLKSIYLCLAFLSLAQSFFQFCSPVFTKMPLTHNYTFSCYYCVTLIICAGFLEAQKKLHQVRLHCSSCILERQRIGMRSMNIQLFIK